MTSKTGCTSFNPYLTAASEPSVIIVAAQSLQAQHMQMSEIYHKLSEEETFMSETWQITYCRLQWWHTAVIILGLHTPILTQSSLLCYLPCAHFTYIYSVSSFLSGVIDHFLNLCWFRLKCMWVYVSKCMCLVPAWLLVSSSTCLYCSDEVVASPSGAIGHGYMSGGQPAMMQDLSVY